MRRRWVQVMDVHLRHEKAFALAVAALVILGLAVALGPRENKVVGAGGASAEESGATGSTTTTDGVVFTAPGELILVVEEPTPPPTEGTVTAGGTTGGAVSPGTTEVPASSPAPTPTTTGSRSPAPSDSDSVAGRSISAPAPAAPATGDPRPGDEIALGEESQRAAGSIDEVGLLADAPELSGMANAAPRVDPETELAGLGTRDSSSVPWMLLIAANAGIAMVAVLILRLRR